MRRPPAAPAAAPAAALVAALVAAMLALAATALAQVPELSLGRRNAAIADPFSDAVGMAELKDGRVIVSDRIEKSFSLADFRTGNRQVLGRNGTGPNEYQLPFGPIRWRGDTLLGYDPNNRRLLRITQDGAITGAIPFPAARARGVTGWAPPRGVDASGRIYWDSPVIEMEPVVKRSMKANLVRWLPGADSVDVAMQFADHGAFEHDFRYRPIPQTDAWVVAADGRIGILSASEYRLRWYKDGRLVETGPPVPYTPVRLTAAERDAFRARKALEPMSGAGGAGVRSGDPASTPAAAGARAKAAWPDELFPPQMPPFEVNGALLAPNGDVWVKRTGAAGELVAHVDILDAHGKLRGTLRLPPRTKLLALGASSVYLIATDDDGLQTLERYAYPPRAP